MSKTKNFLAKLMLKRANKKGILENFQNLFVSLAGLTIVAVVAFLIMSQVSTNTQVVADANATRAVQNMQTAAADTVDWVDLAVIVLVGVLLIGAIAFIRGRR